VLIKHEVMFFEVTFIICKLYPVAGYIVESVFYCRKSWTISFVMLVEDKLYFFKEQKTDGRSVHRDCVSLRRCSLELATLAVFRTTTLLSVDNIHFCMFYLTTKSTA